MNQPKGANLLLVSAFVAIVGILAAFLVPAFMTNQNKEKTDRELDTVLVQIADRLDSFYHDNGFYPEIGRYPDGEPMKQKRVWEKNSANGFWHTLGYTPDGGATYMDYKVITTKDHQGYMIIARANVDGVAPKAYYRLQKLPQDEDGLVTFPQWNMKAVNYLNESRYCFDNPFSMPEADATNENWRSGIVPCSPNYGTYVF